MSQIEVNTNVNSVNVENTINTVAVDQNFDNIVVIPQIITNVVEVVTPGPKGDKGEPGNPDLFTSSFVTTASFDAFTSSYYNASASFDVRILANSSSIVILSSSFLNSSASFNTRILANSSSIGILSSSFLTTSASLSASISLLSGSYLNSSASFNTRILANSSSIGTLSSSFLAFSSSYTTGSFTGSFKGVFTGSLFGTSSYAVTASYANNVSPFISGAISGSVGYLPVFSSSNALNNSIVYQDNKGVAINTTSFNAPHEALRVVQVDTSSFTVLQGDGTLNNYLQLNIKNESLGVSASSDLVATAGNGNENINYIDVGINGPNYNVPNGIGQGNDAYVYSTGQHLHIGNASNNTVTFFVGGFDESLYRKLLLNANNQHELTGSLNISSSLIVNDGITGSLFGTASHVDTLVSASFQTSTDNITLFYGNNTSASFTVDNTNSASYAATASYADDFKVAGTLTAQTIVVQTVTSSVIYSSGSNVFGNDLNNTQVFTGSVKITGSLSVNGVDYIGTSASLDSRILAVSSSVGILSSSYLNSSASFDTRILNNSSSIGILSSSFLAFSSSYNTGSFTGSFAGDGGGLTNISASSVVGLNLSQISSGSVTASVSPVYGFRVNSNTSITGALIVNNGITGSLFGTASFSTSGSYAFAATSASYALSASYAYDSTSGSYAVTASFIDGGFY